jgi:tetratricopeptide (TPR) repeat protein
MFTPHTLAEGIETVVGACNGFSAEQRMEQETPLFARAIWRNIPRDADAVLDYGCGIGRIAKALLTLDPMLRIDAVDTSEDERNLAREYVGNPGRFTLGRPEVVRRQYKLIYCVYVLQHVPAIDLRDTIRHLSSLLMDDGVLVYCSSDLRMSISSNGTGFIDDRVLGVNVRAELERQFVTRGPLFSDAELQGNPILKAMIGGGGGIAHPAILYTKPSTQRPLPQAAYQAAAVEDQTAKAQREFDLGKAAMDAKESDRAVIHYTQAAALAPHSGLPWVGLAQAAGSKFDLKELERCCAESLKREPLADAYNQLAFAHAQNEDYDQWEAVIRKGLELDPQHKSLLFTRGLRNLILGNWSAGWEGWEYRESRQQVVAAMQKNAPLLPEWDGTGNPGRILAVAEAGLGDKLLFARYLPILAERGAEITLLAGSDQLTQLFRDNAERLGIAHVIRVEGTVDIAKVDYWVGVESLPLLLNRAVPERLGAYLAADPERIKTIGSTLPKRKRGEKRLGICWRGSPVPEPYRSMEWGVFSPILDHLHASVVSLSPESECPDPRVDGSLIREAKDLSDTAAIIANLDAVVTIDTSVAHLSAALGKPTYVLRAFPGEWRWGIGGNTSPWYGDHVKVFRQTTRGDWTDVCKSVCEALDSRQNGRG